MRFIVASRSNGATQGADGCFAGNLETREFPLSPALDRVGATRERERDGRPTYVFVIGGKPLGMQRERERKRANAIL